MRMRTELLAVALCACTHAGSGSGELQKPAAQGTGAEQPEGTVDFQWQSGSDPSEGSIVAKLPDGRTFEGTFLQLTSTTLEPSYMPYYNTWAGPRWGMIGPWYAGPQEQFVTHYSGKLMAHLSSADGTRMRCEFIARTPESGLAGGAEGDCQLSTQESVFGAVIH